VVVIVVVVALCRKLLPDAAQRVRICLEHGNAARSGPWAAVALNAVALGGAAVVNSAAPQAPAGAQRWKRGDRFSGAVEQQRLS
jgi:hypothetical protein